MVELPYSIEVFFAIQAQYNADWFPAAPAGWLLMLLAVAMTFRRVDRPLAASDPAGRFIALILASGWMLAGALQQLAYMRELDFLAPWYGAGLILQGALLLSWGVALGRLHWRLGRDPASIIGIALAFAGLVLHPLAILAAGQAPDALPLAGTAPDATAIVTAGLLLALRPAPPLTLFVLPLSWACVAAAHGWLLGYWPDYMVIAAMLVALPLAIRRRLTEREPLGIGR